MCSKNTHILLFLSNLGWTVVPTQSPSDDPPVLRLMASPQAMHTHSVTSLTLLNPLSPNIHIQILHTDI